uniref:(northern house mosquito) hypothetical protein n=1 Tax=Culex pipiens TaxID=7175 RepID=A0A8D8FU62_CULPI
MLTGMFICWSCLDCCCCCWSSPWSSVGISIGPWFWRIILPSLPSCCCCCWTYVCVCPPSCPCASVMLYVMFPVALSWLVITISPPPPPPAAFTSLLSEWIFSKMLSRSPSEMVLLLWLVVRVAPELTDVPAPISLCCCCCCWSCWPLLSAAAFALTIFLLVVTVVGWGAVPIVEMGVWTAPPWCIFMC